MAGVSSIFNDNVHDKSGNKVDLKTKCAGKIVGIYFSAHWCPPCRGFTPQLVQFYNKHRVDKNFEIIFVSSDQDEAHFKEYYNEMPWLALAFSNRELKENLSEKYNIEGIPTLILIEGNSGEMLSKSGDPDRVSHVSEDPDAEKFPWEF